MRKFTSPNELIFFGPYWLAVLTLFFPSVLTIGKATATEPSPQKPGQAEVDTILVNQVAHVNEVLKKIKIDPHSNPKYDGPSRALYLDGTNTKYDYKPLSEIPWLRKLTAYDTFSDADMVALKNLNDLDELSLWSASVTDKGMAQIKNLKKLKSVYLYRTKVKGTTLGAHPNLQCLDMSYAEETPPDQKIDERVLQTLPQSLKKLSLQRSMVTGAGLSRFDDLEYLYIIGGPIDANIAKAFRKLGKLSYLELASTNFSGPGFAGLQSLQDADFYKTPLNGASLKELTALPKLKTLGLSDTPIDDKALSDLSTSPTLEQLKLNSTQITDKGLPNIAELSTLTHLELQKTGITDAGLATIANLPRLKALHLQNTNITDKGVERIKQLSKLEILWLNNTRISNECLKVLAGMQSLRMVSTVNTRVTKEALQDFRRAHQKCTIQ